MDKTTIKSGPGRLYKVFNPIEQPGKTLVIRDGEDITIAHLQLDEIFEHVQIDEDTGEEVKVPGLVLDIVFTHSLQTETDGKDLTLFWQ